MSNAGEMRGLRFGLDIFFVGKRWAFRLICSREFGVYEKKNEEGIKTGPGCNE